MKKKVAIIGSCVTRDLFSFDINEMNNDDVSLYLTRSTVASMVGESLQEFIHPSLDEITKFDDKKFIIDLNKSHFKLLQNTDWDVLIVDLIDERHSTYYFGNRILTCTKSSKKYINEFIKISGGKIFEPLSRDMIALTNEALEKFKLFLKKISKERAVLIHRATYATHFLNDGKIVSFDSKNLSNINKWNFFLNNCYDRLLNGSGFIGVKVPDKKIIAGGNHKWDLTPFHYDKSYYDILSKLLIPYISDKIESVI